MTWESFDFITKKNLIDNFWDVILVSIIKQMYIFVLCTLYNQNYYKHTPMPNLFYFISNYKIKAFDSFYLKKSYNKDETNLDTKT